jgi:HEAT repeat protein
LRRAAAEALGAFKDPRPLDALLQTLRDKDLDVQSAAAGALGELNDPRALELLVQTLRDKDFGVRYAAAKALGELKDPRALDPLLQALRDEDPLVRQSAVEGLGELKDPRARDPLLQTLRARDVAGLFIERGAGEYAFFHLSFQEYLCARYITRRRREIEAHLKRRLDTSDRPIPHSAASLTPLRSRRRRSRSKGSHRP